MPLAALVGVLVLASASTSGGALANPLECPAGQTCTGDASASCADARPGGHQVGDGCEEQSTTATDTTPTATDGTATEPTTTETVAETETLPPATEPTTSVPAARPRPAPSQAPRTSGAAAARSVAADPAAPEAAPVLAPPPGITPRLTAGGYVFPVYGPAAFVDTFGAPRATVPWHHGTDIFAPAGAPVLAVAAGTVFSVGWNDVGGNRLWLRDREGNEFYYAHLSAFSPLAVNGAKVDAGVVLGFVGNTGDAAGTPPHLHFEIHPVSLLSLGYDGAVNPTGYLRSWQRLQDLPFGFRGLAAGLRLPPGVRVSDSAVPRPGAVLLAASDISSASGLEPGSLARALAGSRAPLPRRLDAGSSSSAETGADTKRTRTQALAFGRADAANDGVEAGLRKQALAFAASEARFSFSVWDALALCEAGGDWSAHTGNGFAGGLQFAPGTWRGYGGERFADSAAGATREEQIAIAQLVLAAEGWDAWPVCSRKLGLR